MQFGVTEQTGASCEEVLGEAFTTIAAENVDKLLKKGIIYASLQIIITCQGHLPVRVPCQRATLEARVREPFIS